MKSPKLMSLVIFMAIGVLALPQLSTADSELYRENKSKSTRDTTINAYARLIAKNDGSAVATLSAFVIKSGLSGVGKGRAMLILYDMDGKVLMNLSAGDTVSADPNHGYAEKKDSQSSTLLTPIAYKVAACSLVLSVEDRNIITDIEETTRDTLNRWVQDALKQANLSAIVDIPVGGSIPLPGVDGGLKRIK